MNIGINPFLFTSLFTDRSTKLFAQFARRGFDCVEIAVEQPQHIDPAQVKRVLARHGRRPGSVCACFPPERDLRGTKAQQKSAIDYVRRLVDLAVKGLKFFTPGLEMNLSLRCGVGTERKPQSQK